MENSQVKLAKIFKKLENPNPIGNVVGKVINPLPNLKISILNGELILEKEQLYMCEKLFDDYIRDFEIQQSDFELKGDTFLLTASPFVINDTTPAGSRPIPTIPEGQTSNVEIAGKADQIGKITFVDTLKKDDLVLLVPTIDEQMFFIVDKIRKVN